MAAEYQIDKLHLSTLSLTTHLCPVVRKLLRTTSILIRNASAHPFE